MSGDWTHYLYRANGDGTDTLLEGDIPLADPEITTTLSGTDTIRASLSPEYPELAPLMIPWSTFVVSEYRNAIRAACIVDDVMDDGPVRAFTSRGFFGYLDQMPYVGSYSGVQIDPLDAARTIWSHVQSRKTFNLGLVLDDTTSPVRIGVEEKDVQFTTGAGEDVDFTAGPYTLADWKTDDLSSDFTNLADFTPFDFSEKHTWSGEKINHRLQLGYPRIGIRQPNLRFAVGENVRVLPQFDQNGDNYASEVMMLGAGEGRKKLRKLVSTNTTGRLGRIAVSDDSSLATQREVNSAATSLARSYGGGIDVETITVMDHDNAPIGSWANGDDIFLEGDDLPWNESVGIWLRVLNTVYHPGSERCDLTVTRTERTR